MRINILLDYEKSITPIVTDAETGKLIAGLERCDIELGPSIPPVARLVMRVAINDDGDYREEVVRADVARLDVTLSASRLEPCSKTHDTTMVKIVPGVYSAIDNHPFDFHDTKCQVDVHQHSNIPDPGPFPAIPDDIGIRCYPPIPCNQQVDLTGVVFPHDLPPGLTEGATVVKAEQDPVLPATGWHSHLVALCDSLPTGATILVPDASMVKVVAERCRNRDREDLKVEVVA